MARPKKQTVDYFPHYCSHNKTMFILEQKYGNDGYAFWFKLLEMLGSSEGHYLCFANGMDWEFLIAKTRLDREKCTEILDLLATLEAVDNKLWFKNKVVWSDGFIENIKDVYRFRVMEIPSKPSLTRGKSSSGRVSDIINPQSKVKESKVKESKDKYGEFVLLSKEEYQKLIEQFGKEVTDEKIIDLNLGIGSKGYKYKDHYLTILSWDRREKKKKKEEGGSSIKERALNCLKRNPGCYKYSDNDNEVCRMCKTLR